MGFAMRIQLNDEVIKKSTFKSMYINGQKVIEKTGSKYIGFVPDFGCFAVAPNNLSNLILGSIISVFHSNALSFIFSFLRFKNFYSF